MASFWRTVGDTKYELKYLQLRQEKSLPWCLNAK